MAREIYDTLYLKDPNLVYLWRFENDYTSSRNSNTGSAVGTGNAFANSFLGKYLSLNGSGGVDISNTNLNKQSFSVTMWVNPNAAQVSRIFISNYDAPSGVTNGWGLGISDGTNNKPKFFTSRVGGSDNLEGTALTSSAWTFLVFTFDGSTKKIYNNASLDVSVAWAQTINYGTTNGTIGYLKENGAGSQRFNGLMDDLAWWSKALTATEISWLYNNTIPKINLPMRQRSRTFAV